MEKNEPKKRGRLVIILVFLVILLGALAVVYLTKNKDNNTNEPANNSREESVPQSEEEPKPDVTEVPQQAPSEDSKIEREESGSSPESESTDSQGSESEKPEAVVLEDGGDVEIVIPDEMDGEGF